MKKTIYIPTYNRPEAVNELFIRYLEAFKNLGFDVFVVDSSTDDETLSVVGKYKDQVVYERVPSEIHSNSKVYSIYKEFAKSDYDYIWVHSDSIRWNMAGLERISQIVDRNEYDLIVPNYRDEIGIGDRMYDDRNAFFADCAWHMTLYGAVILRRNVLRDADWDHLEKTYLVPDRINFSHVAMYFEQIAKMDGFSAFHVGLPRNCLASTLYKKGSGWRKDAFYIHCICWPSMVRALPSVYTVKEKVIRTQALYCGDFTPEGLKKLRAEGILGPGVFFRYFRSWSDVSDISRMRLLFYAFLPRRIAGTLTEGRRNEKAVINKLKKFCKDHARIYIYGCGYFGDIYASFLEDIGIGYEGFLVSEGQKDKSVLRGKPVMTVSEDILRDKENGIIFAMNELNYSQVMDGLSSYTVNAGLFREYTD